MPATTQARNVQKPAWRNKTAAHWRDVCRDWSFKTQRVKTADLGGQPNTPFEQAFSNLAHSYVADKAPKLLEYEVGFQLIEKSSDNTKAVGVFGFKIGDQQWLYIPVFFLNGELKGHELLYIKNQDLFVPLKDNWVNYLLGRKPNILGKGVDRNLSRLGVLNPNLFQLSRSPYKIASTMPKMASWAVDFLPVLAKLALTKVAFTPGEMFLDAVQRAGRPGFDYLCKVAEQYPLVFQQVVKFYGQDRLTKLAHDIGTQQRLDGSSRNLLGRLAQTKTAAPKKLPDAEVIVRRDIFNGGLPDFRLNDKEHLQLADEGRIVRDNRPNSAISKVYNMTNSFRLFNPAETGVYEVLVRPDKFEKCLVILAPYGENGRQDFCTLVSLASKERWLNTHPTRIFCQAQHTQEAWNEWYDKLDDIGDLPVASDSWRGQQFVLLSRNGQGTCPMRVNEKFVGPDDAADSGATYEVRFDDYCSNEYRQSWRAEGTGECCGPISCSITHDSHPCIKTVRITDRQGTKFLANRHEIVVPGGFKKLIVKEEETKEDWDKKDYPSSSMGHSRPSALQPGSPEDILFAVRANLPSLRIAADSGRLDVNGEKMDKEAAFKCLFLNWSLRADTADILIKAAEDAPRKTQEYFVKRAGPHLTEGGGPTAPAPLERPWQSDQWMGTQVPMEIPWQQGQYVPSMIPNMADRELYRPIGPEPDDMNLAGQAAQTGQKEVFDTAMFSSMLNTVRQDSMIDRELGPLMKGMNSLGTIYFQSLWHGDEFEKRFGASEIPELIDGIRNSFEGVGDVVLKLKQKGVEPFSMEGSDVDLSGIANQ